MSCGRRELKKALTRERISSAALELALLHGPDAVTVEQIAAAADVSPRTFFNYFPSKWDAIVDFDMAEKDGFAEDVLARPADETPLEALRSVFLVRHVGFSPDEAVLVAQRMALVEQHDGLHRRFLGYFATFERALIEAVAKRIGTDPDVDPYPSILVASVSAAMRTAFRRAAESNGEDDFVALATGAFDLLASGFSPSVEPLPTAAP